MKLKCYSTLPQDVNKPYNQNIKFKLNNFCIDVYEFSHTKIQRKGNNNEQFINNIQTSKENRQ